MSQYARRPHGPDVRAQAREHVREALAHLADVEDLAADMDIRLAEGASCRFCSKSRNDTEPIQNSSKFPYRRGIELTAARPSYPMSAKNLSGVSQKICLS